MSDRTRELECVIADLKQQVRDAEKERDALRAELMEQCRLLGMSAEREAKHLAHIAALEKERDDLRAALAAAPKPEVKRWIFLTSTCTNEPYNSNPTLRPPSRTPARNRRGFSGWNRVFKVFVMLLFTLPA